MSRDCDVYWQYLSDHVTWPRHVITIRQYRSVVDLRSHLSPWQCTCRKWAWPEWAWSGTDNRQTIIEWHIDTRAGSVSVFGVGIGIRYFHRYFFHVGSVFGIGILKYIGIRYRYRYFWNTGWKLQIFGIPTSIWHPCWGWPPSEN